MQCDSCGKRHLRTAGKKHGRDIKRCRQMADPAYRSLRYLGLLLLGTLGVVAVKPSCRRRAGVQPVAHAGHEQSLPYSGRSRLHQIGDDDADRCGAW